jgi:hypothetical protein
MPAGKRIEAVQRAVRAGFTAVARSDNTDYDEGGIRELAARVKEKGRKRLAGETRKTVTR